MDEDWDYLIVLDALRYDYFSRFYKRFFDGKLKKVFSAGSHTLEWCVNSFNTMYSDVTYLSANPYINSICGITGYGIEGGFDAKRHFHKIVDLWNSGWSDKFGTVPPIKVNEATLKLKEQYPNKRFIIHYIQPHEPYISPKFSLIGYPRQSLSNGRVLAGTGNSKTRFAEKIFYFFEVFANKIGLSHVYTLELRKYLGLSPSNPMDAVRRTFGTDGLRKAYIENLLIVLNCVAALISELSGMITITSDHGEFLGEDGMFNHFPSQHPILRSVPWFQVSKIKKVP